MDELPTWVRNLSTAGAALNDAAKECEQQDGAYRVGRRDTRTPLIGCLRGVCVEGGGEGGVHMGLQGEVSES